MDLPSWCRTLTRPAPCAFNWFQACRSACAKAEACLSCDQFRSSEGREMAWTTPTLVEICIGLEINGYLPAEF
jgi:coenzyme PQQ precursor peptide PqqA